MGRGVGRGRPSVVPPPPPPPLPPPAQERGSLLWREVRILLREPGPRGGEVLLRLREIESERAEVERGLALRHLLVVRRAEGAWRELVDLAVVFEFSLDRNRCVDPIPHVREGQEEDEDQGA